MRQLSENLTFLPASVPVSESRYPDREWMITDRLTFLAITKDSIEAADEPRPKEVLNRPEADK